MTHDYIKAGWVQRVVRIRKDYLNVCKYLEYKATSVSKDKSIFFNDIFTYSLNYLANNGFNFSIEFYDQRRVPKGFLFLKQTSDNIDSALEYYSKILLAQSRKLLVCELIELILYIYCTNEFPENEIAELNIQWGIKPTAKKVN